MARFRQLLLAALFIGSSIAPALAATRGEIIVEGAQTFPESITSTRDGTLFTGSSNAGGVYRAAPGAASAAPWIEPGRDGLLSTFGVLADEATGVLWVCSARFGPPAPNAPQGGLFAFDLKSGAFRKHYLLPGGVGLCNDIAIGPDKAAYVADTTAGRLLRLAPGAEALEVWAQTADLAGADGLAFVGGALIVNSYNSGKLLRYTVGKDGKAGPATVLTTSRPLQQPDGMRAVGGNRLALAEGVGRISLLTVHGDHVEVSTLREGLVGPVGVTLDHGMLWALEGKLSLRRTPDVTAAPFKAYAIALPKP